MGLSHWLAGIAVAAAGGGDSLLLDTYSSAAVAYSLRKVRTAYSGSAIRVQRSNDDTEQDIGFDGSGNLDTSALASFVGSNTGYIVTWYDQSGNSNNATATGSTRPVIVSSGTLVELGSKPALSASSTQWVTLSSALAIASGQSGSYWMTYHKDASTSAILLTSSTNYMWYDDGADQYITNSKVINVGSAPYSTGTRYLHNCIMTYSSSAELFKNGTSIGSFSGSYGGASGMSTLPSIGTFRTAKLLMQEFVFWQSDQASNRSGIESNINDYWSIY
ncbi:MAG: hypothetical protein E6Q97_12685 [Desulfurellales bacterium]|nr:MAG: hypothetical protein E6Q97_12685 [Desulfurellales bacterium]